MKKFIETAVFLVSIIAGIYLICFLGKPAHYSEYIIDEETFEDIVAERGQALSLLDALNFDEETLFFDVSDNTFYYSLIEGNAKAYDPIVKVKSKNKDLKIAFLEDRITSEKIKKNDTITVLTYTGTEYCCYSLKCTILPLMNIECREEIMDDSLPMNISLFDNRQGAAQRVIMSAGNIHVRGGSSRAYPKKGYRFSLTQESIGGNTRTNQVSLLGMRQDDDWLLYAAYSDQEKIRNVFSTNLWKYTCATDNAQGIDTGTEYRYLELFMNGEYWGLYALGYPIDEKQLGIDKGNEEEALYKIVDWTNGDRLEYAEEGYLIGYEDKGTDEGNGNWLPLQNYFDALSSHRDDNEKLYAGIDIDNVIDIYLFYTLIQGVDNIEKENVKNNYFSLHSRQGKVVAMYSPWDMDAAWGNMWVPFMQQPYNMSETYNLVMESGVVNQLIVNGDDSIWGKIFDKYRYLRENGWSNENINSLLDEYEEDIFASGAYQRDMERWPEGLYGDAANGMDIFRAFVTRRIRETDEYFKRLHAVCGESIFIRRSAQYASFDGGSFLIEINNKELLTDSDYIDLFEYMGIDLSAITDEVRFIIAKPAAGKYEYLSELSGSEENLSFSTVREGLYQISLDGTPCYTSTVFSMPMIEMVSVKDGMTDTFDFVQENDMRTQATPFESLSMYLEGLSVTKYKAVIEINNPNIRQDPAYIRLFENLGITGGMIHETTDFIVWDGASKEAAALENFHTSGSTCDTSFGTLNVYANEQGEYGVYMDGRECFVSSAWQNEDEKKDVRILLFDSDSHEMLEDISFLYEDIM
ncbi:MAG: CotH kinase family protein [Bacteroidales bacterium]|nr:CotH kinase family protein [Bacteroidales bacterium]MCM1414702.1 CotH kinase family protein [bacterium]MCM1422511.1 CotH kinase family protein [bacterium]